MATPDDTTSVPQLVFSFTEAEIWRPVVGWEGHYEVSNCGQVRSVDKRTLSRPRADGSPAYRIAKGKILRSQGYGREKKWRTTYLWREQQGTHRPVHQLVLEAFVGLRPEGYVANHKDGNPVNNHVSNLEWCTVTENNRHALATGLRRMYGEDHHGHRFTTEQVQEMRRLHKQGLSIPSVARHFQASMHTIRKIIERKTWKHVPEDD